MAPEVQLGQQRIAPQRRSSALVRDAPAHLSADGVLVLEIGHERPHFEAAFPELDAVWLPTSAGDDQVLLLTRAALATPTSA